jgi:dTDP-4-amino-4,6-dideoxygalactose transaminase
VFRQRAAFDADHSPENATELARNYAIYDRISRIRPYALSVARSGIAHNTLARRHSNYRVLLQEFSKYDFVETLPADGVMPWIFPLFVEDPHRGKAVKLLTAGGIESGVYHFDVNRNMLNPDFRKCVAIPCHQGLSDNDLSMIVEIVKRAL